MRVDELVRALRQRDALTARVLYVELARQSVSGIAAPVSNDELDRAIAASVVELLAARLNAAAPDWTREIGPLTAPFVLVTVRTQARLDRLLRESPPALRTRNLVAPENFLQSV